MTARTASLASTVGPRRRLHDSIGKLAGTETVTRRVKNVDDTAATYTADVDMPGFDVHVSPSAFTLAPGAEQEFTVTFTRTSAPLDEWVTGSLTWTGGGHTVRSPIALQPVVVGAPTEVDVAFSPGGSVDIDVVAGFDGALDPALQGLVGVTPIADSVAAGGFDFDNPTADADTDHYTVTVPEGALVARFSLDAVDDASDLDLIVYKDGEFVDLSASFAADEELTFLSPVPGTYDVYVNGFTTPGGSTQYRLSNFVVPPGDLANSDISPDSAAVLTGQQATFTAAWTGLDPARRWLGVVTYGATTSGGTAAASEAVTLLSVG